MLKVALEIMLSQKFAALFALMVFASQGVIGRPSIPNTIGAAGEEVAEDFGEPVSAFVTTELLGVAFEGPDPE